MEQIEPMEKVKMLGQFQFMDQLLHNQQLNQSGAGS